ncbi:hypothetical protein L209DRAFT_739245 [Thermothelomyces heterothallicus CBS 203.75]
MYGAPGMLVTCGATPPRGNSQPFPFSNPLGPVEPSPFPRVADRRVNIVKGVHQTGEERLYGQANRPEVYHRKAEGRRTDTPVAQCGSWLVEIINILPEGLGPEKHCCAGRGVV